MSIGCTTRARVLRRGHSQPRRDRRGAFPAFVAWATAAAVGIGSTMPQHAVGQSTSPAPRVSYEGTTLVVDGRRYAPEVDAEECGSALFLCKRSSIGTAWMKARVEVFTAEGAGESVRAALTGLGLPVDVERPEWLEPEWIIVGVPVGFEVHWATALTAVPGVVSTTPAHAQAADPRWAPAVPGLPTATDVTYDGETLIVRGVRYPRLEGLRYCRLFSRQVCGPTSVRGWRLEQIEVGYRPGSRLEVAGRLRDAGLAVFDESASSTRFSVFVPGFYEEQWARALSAEPSVLFARVDSPPHVGGNTVTSSASLLHPRGAIGLDASERQRALASIASMRTADHCGEPKLAIITGHADVQETADPIRLAAARASYVRDLIARHLGPPTVIWAENKGADQAVAPAGRPENIRTEIEVLADVAPRECTVARTVR